MYKLVWILVFLTTFTSSAQNLTKLYNDFIPKDVFENKELLNSVEYNLGYNADIHPELNYYYLLYVFNFYENKLKNPDSNYLNLYKIYRQKLLADRSAWADYQIKNILPVTRIRIKKNAMISFYNPLLFIEREIVYESAKLPVDENLKEFISYLYYTGERTDYDNEKVYFELNKSRISELISKLENEYSLFDSYSFEQKISKIEKDISNWYIIGKNSLSNYRLSTEYDTYELSINTFINEFRTTNSIILGLGVNYLMKHPEDIDHTFIFQDKPLPTFINPISYDFPVKLSYYPLINVNLGYRLALKSELGFLSYLKFKLGYTYMSLEYEDSFKGEEFYSFTYNVISGNERLMYVYRSNGLKNKSTYFLTAHLSSPLFYLNKYIYLELGVEASVYSFKFDFEVEKQSVREQNSNRSVESTETFQIPFKETQTNIFPVVSIVYEPISNLNFSLYNTMIKQIYLITIGANYFF